MRTWFTADTHFGHANIIKFCGRPFKDVDEMDRTLIEVWNAVVRPEDTVWHLGDFAFRSTKDPEAYLRRLHGTKHLVVGNHDGEASRSAPSWGSVQDMAHVSIDGHRVTLCHYAMRVWPRSHHGALHFYGHSHGNLPGDSQSCDVGMDCWGFCPVTLAQILPHLRGLPESGGDR